MTISGDEEPYFHEAPPHPGEVLKREFLEPLDMTQTELAETMGTSQAFANHVVHKKRRITPAKAVELENAFGVSAEFWLNLQQTYDLYQARKELREDT